MIHIFRTRPHQLHLGHPTNSPINSDAPYSSRNQKRLQHPNRPALANALPSIQVSNVGPTIQKGKHPHVRAGTISNRGFEWQWAVMAYYAGAPRVFPALEGAPTTCRSYPSFLMSARSTIPVPFFQVACIDSCPRMYVSIRKPDAHSSLHPRWLVSCNTRGPSIVFAVVPPPGRRCTHTPSHASLDMAMPLCLGIH
ncbi:hypothetical protein J3458_009382 [Metarhizium acridum]|uniref:uncharacterized protein n=1 Tax=Metarhizium acridum TaxID=92637 RepID=UPI001C6D0799|nr:hypothetical protein J3458_009382 [Metarhizium acridum]